MFHYVKTAHYRISCNPSHQMMSLIWRHIMSWWDAWGMDEQCGCCGRKSFYCSKHALLNDDDDEDTETFGEYVESTKQLKKIWRQEGMLKRRIPWKWQPRCFSPWYWWIFLWLIFLWLNRRSFMTHSSNSGTLTQLICHPLSPYPIIHMMSQMSSLIVIHFYSYDCFSCVASSFFHGCTIGLTEAAHHDSFLTHFWLTLFSMLVEYSGNNIVITLSA